MQTTKAEKSVIDDHRIQTVKFAISIKEEQDKLTMLYWLPKLTKG